jgi:hypothetical protein
MKTMIDGRKILERLRASGKLKKAIAKAVKINPQ